MRKTNIDLQYQAYLKKYYEALNEYNMDFIRPLTKGEYKNARASYIADKQAEIKTISRKRSIIYSVLLTDL